MTGLDPKRCEAEYRGMETALKAMQARRAKMKEDIQSMEEDLNMRLIKEQKFRKTTAKKLKKHFNAYMKTRGHQGGIAIDFEKKTLEFDVILKGTNVASAEGDRPKKRAKKDTKTLSLFLWVPLDNLIPRQGCQCQWHPHMLLSAPPSRHSRTWRLSSD